MRKGENASAGHATVNLQCKGNRQTVSPLRSRGCVTVRDGDGEGSRRRRMRAAARRHFSSFLVSGSRTRPMHMRPGQGPPSLAAGPVDGSPAAADQLEGDALVGVPPLAAHPAGRSLADRFAPSERLAGLAPWFGYPAGQSNRANRKASPRRRAPTVPPRPRGRRVIDGDLARELGGARARGGRNCFRRNGESERAGRSTPSLTRRARSLFTACWDTGSRECHDGREATGRSVGDRARPRSGLSPARCAASTCAPGAAGARWRPGRGVGSAPVLDAGRFLLWNAPSRGCARDLRAHRMAEAVAS
jgi:hypothetical protein